MGYYLVGEKMMNELVEDHERDEDGGGRAVVETWLHTDPQPSWRRLILALDRAEETSVADTIRGYAEPLRGRI